MSIDNDDERAAIAAVERSKGGVMRRFKVGQRVKVVVGHWGRSKLVGRLGTVVRLRKADDQAWVEFDEPLPERYQHFPADDRRSRHALVWPDECEETNER